MVSKGNRGADQRREASCISLELSREGLVEQRFFQGVQRGELLLVEAFEALGFGGEGVEVGGELLLRLQAGKPELEIEQVISVHLQHSSSGRPLTRLFGEAFAQEEVEEKIASDRVWTWRTASVRHSGVSVKCS